MLKGDNSPRFWREAYRHSFLLYCGLLSAQSLSHKSALSHFILVAEVRVYPNVILGEKVVGIVAEGNLVKTIS
jgi:hypothetical protein